VDAMASGRFDRNTATRTATLTPSPESNPTPSTTDSGIPSSTVPSTMAFGESVCCRPLIDFRAAPPARSMRRSPTKKVSAPANRPSTTGVPPAASTASRTRSYVSALMRTPAPKAMISPSVRGPIRCTSAMAAPSSSDGGGEEPHAERRDHANR
jgi:hypothetical protein